MNIKQKLTSRKWWLSVAAFLGSIGATVAGITTDKEVVATIGIICATLSAAIYAACEASVDAASIGASASETEEGEDNG
ncbi:MAG: hypothetical protein LUH03_10955 [Oscillospiraceae bacterium]|nr:hypothetical protein [Oscillospiraceae bacterium]